MEYVCGSWKTILPTLINSFLYTSLVTQMVKHLPAMRETRVLSLGQKDPLEKGMATHSSILGWGDFLGRGALQAIVHGIPKSQT